MVTRRIAIRLNYKQFQKLVALANRVISELTGSGIYISPIPSISDTQDATTAVEDLIAKWGPEGARGSAQDYLDLCAASKTLLRVLRALGNYVNTTASIAANGDNDLLASLLAASGFDLSKVPGEQPVLEAVVDLRTSKMRNLNANQAKIVFKRPLNTTSARDVNHYELRRSATNNYSDSVLIASQTHASYIDTNNTGANVTWTYWVVPYNTKGAGAVSEALPVTIMGIA